MLTALLFLVYSPLFLKPFRYTKQDMDCITADSAAVHVPAFGRGSVFG